MWAVYLGLALLGIPEIFYFFWEMQIMSPYISGWGGLLLLAYGGLGRIKDQGIDRNRLRSPWIVALVALLIAAWAVYDDLSLPEPQIHSEAPAAADSAAETLQIAVPLIAKWEGLRTKAYLDVVGVWTVCFGETKGVKPGDSYTEAECRAMLADQVAVYRAGLHEYFSAETIANRLPPTRDAAYTSLAYNVGIAGAGKSTATRRLNAGNIAGGCEALTWWNKGGGRVLRGLVRRRSEERALCLEGLA
ncbi:lysozyme [Roseovarius sp. PS-C2]|nr:lysozyme [Roseovarius sp. PS-C2]MBU3262053.1 lysozyme [Roseovarius sp. PS-C2]